MTTVTIGICDLCTTRGPIHAALVAWDVPIGEMFANIDRCVDEAACRARVEAAGEPWPLRDPPHRTEAPL